MAVLLTTTMASAEASVSIELYGVVTNVVKRNTDIEFTRFSPGDEVRGSVTYDPATVFTRYVRSNGEFFFGLDAVTGLELTVGDYDVGFRGTPRPANSDGNFANVVDNVPGAGQDALQLVAKGETNKNAGQAYGEQVSGFDLSGVAMLFWDSTGTAFDFPTDDAQLPPAFDFNDFDEQFQNAIDPASLNFRQGLVFQPAGSNLDLDEPAVRVEFELFTRFGTNAIPEATSCLVWLGLVVGGLVKRRR